MYWGARYAVVNKVPCRKLSSVHWDLCGGAQTLHALWAEQIWCTFILHTICAPNILLRGTEFLHGHHFVRKTFGNIIHNLILQSFKVIGYSIGYSTGCSTGYSMGYSMGYSIGYSIGYFIGYSISYSIGYSRIQWIEPL